MFQSAKFILALVVSTAVFLSTVQVAEARPHIADRNFERGGGNLSNSVTVNTRRGQASKTVNGNVNRDAGTANSSVRWTAADGRTATYDRGAQRTDNGYSRSRSLATSNGRGVSYDATGTRTNDGGRINRAWANGQGETLATKSVTYNDGTRTTVYPGRDKESKSVTSGGND